MNQPAPDDAEKAQKHGDGPPPGNWKPPRHSVGIIVIMLLLAIVFVTCILAAFELPPFGTDGPHTDDAYVEGHVTVVAPEVPGYVDHVFVDDYAHVRRGQLLVQIDPSSYQARVAQAEANMASRQASLDNNRQSQASARARREQRNAALAAALARLARSAADHRRQAALVGDESVSRRDYDTGLATLRTDEAAIAQARADMHAADADVASSDTEERVLRADLQQAQATLQSAQIDLGRTRIVATSDGTIGRTGGTHVGAYVEAGTALFSLVPDARWVIANYKEAQTSGIRIGQAASFTVDALAGQRFTGHVARIAPATGSEFALVKPDNATGNFVKVPQRIGVYIAIDPGQTLSERLGPGMSVEAFVSTLSPSPAP